MTVARGEPSRAILAVGLIALLACKPAAEGPAAPRNSQGAATTGDQTAATGDAAVASSITFTGDETVVAAKQAFVKETCSRIVGVGDPAGRRCEAIADLGDWILLRSSDAVDKGVRWRWFVGIAMTNGFILMAPDDVDLPPYNEDPVDVIYSLCLEFTANDEPPVDSGLLNVGVIDVTDDGRPDLVFECRETDRWGEHYLRTCPAGEERCTSSPKPKV